MLGMAENLSMGEWSAIIGAVGVAIAGIIGAVTAFILKLRSQDYTFSKTEFDRVIKRLDTMESNYTRCKEEHAVARNDLDHLQSKYNDQEAEVKQLQSEVRRLRQTLANCPECGAKLLRSESGIHQRGSEDIHDV